MKGSSIKEPATVWTCPAPSTPAERHLLQVLATDTSDGDKEGAGGMTMSADIGCSSSGTKEGTGSLLSSSVPTTTSIFDEFNSVDDQDAPAAVLAAAKALRLEIHTAMGDELGAVLLYCTNSLFGSAVKGRRSHGGRNNHPEAEATITMIVE